MKFAFVLLQSDGEKIKTSSALRHCQIVVYFENYLNKKCTVSSKNIAPPNTHNIYYQNNSPILTKPTNELSKQ